MTSETRATGAHIPERRVNKAKRALFEDLQLNLRLRLGRVCDHWPSVELDALTARMTRLRLKYDPISALPENW